MANWYIAQTAVGTGSATSPENAAAPTFYNSSGNWQSPKVAGKIGPGDTVYLIGTITTALVPPLSGTSGNSIVTRGYDETSKISGSIIGIDVASKDDLTISNIDFFGQTGANARPISIGSGAERLLVDSVQINGNGTAVFGVTINGSGINATISHCAIENVSLRGISIASVTSSSISISDVSTDACDSGLVITASPSNIDIDRLTVSNSDGNSGYPAIYVVGVLQAGSVWNDVVIENTLYEDGMRFVGGSNLQINRASISGSKSSSNTKGYGFIISSNPTESATDIAIKDSSFFNNQNDGAGIIQGTSALSGVSFSRCRFYGNGIAGDGARGDGFTSHGSPTGCSVDFSVAYNNTNDSFGIVDASSVAIRHMTGWNNGSTGAVRAECYITSSAACTVQNCLFCNTNGYPVAEIKNDPTTHTWDYNGYVSTLAAPFKIETVAKTFAEWVAATGYDTHSWFVHEHDGVWDCYHGSAPSTKARTLTARPVDITTGKLVDVLGNPFAHAALVVSGVNNGGEIDIWGNATPAQPNIGADQGAAKGFGPWTSFDSTMPTLALASTAPGKLLEVQEWTSASVTKKQIDKVSR